MDRPLPAVPKKGWTSAAALRTGDQLVALNGELVTVEQVQHELLETPVKVYNFEVEDFHTYFVGDEPVLVHNTCKLTPDQQAVVELAKNYKRGISKTDANVLVGWAEEYGINGHYPMIHPNRNGMWSEIEHIKVFKYHIPIK